MLTKYNIHNFTIFFLIFYVKNIGKDYDTGVKDKNSEKIYAHRWVENGQIYETYKSASGRPIDTNEYYN